MSMSDDGSAPVTKIVGLTNGNRTKLGVHTGKKRPISTNRIAIGSRLRGLFLNFFNMGLHSMPTWIPYDYNWTDLVVFIMHTDQKRIRFNWSAPIWYTSGYITDPAFIVANSVGALQSSAECGRT
jgi:hypothetical protein